MFKDIKYIFSKIQRKLRISSVIESSFEFDCRVEAACTIVGVHMARHSFCGYDCVIVNADIGSFCSIADQVYIGGAGHPIHFVSTSPVFLSHRDSVKTKFSKHKYLHLPRTTIGHDVWIGYRSIIKAGVTIGTGAVIGMGAVVTKDVAPYSIVGGNPAREIRRRFEPHVIEALLASKWWEFDPKRLSEAAKKFDNVEAFLKGEGLL